ncbi:exported hypothetical protein [Paraburkholderia piptadeniae]|uniref:Uncharacterized protein n=1 Tax=Paraburkholderia piptadeniae TaxID=1701573 RepID=A0A1N7S5S3_9BURK|nr:exported hypothetical protein [Paraburkholderia piptadeniae]
MPGLPLASALRLAARALPLCGAALTFFAAAKKVSKESGLTPPVLDVYPRALNVPVFHAAVCWPMFVANAPAKRLTRFMHVWHGQGYRTFQSRMPVVNAVAVSYRTPPALVAALRSDGVPCGAKAYTKFAAKGRGNVRCRGPRRVFMKRVRRLISTLATKADQRAAARSVGTLRARG